ncbi:MAG: hypothetical protein Q7J42_00330 [Sulfuritalea sp.]|nr:hypothetical protein [Sulfuritalea sp.]
MKKLIIAMSLCVVSSASMAASVCTGTAGSGTQVSPASTPEFVKTAFTPKCSANTTVDFVENATTAAAGAISSKGNQVFKGHTNGGAVAGTACAAAACVAGEAATASAAALAEGST